jgi:hypothetical protein
MSKRSSITKALSTKINELLVGDNNYTTNLYNNCYPYLKFWDEVDNFPSIYITPGSETREYLPSNFTWGFLNLSVKLYCKGENSSQDLETLLEDFENAIDANRVLTYDDVNSLETTEILVVSITTDEGLLAPYAVGEINLQVRYELPQ